jgi:hypothetical protein
VRNNINNNSLPSLSALLINQEYMEFINICQPHVFASVFSAFAEQAQQHGQ